MKKLTFLMMFFMLGLSSLVSADEVIGVFANSNTNSIQFIDPNTNTATPNYLGGELGSYGGGLFDVVITHGGNTAIVSNFGDSRIFFICLCGGFANPPTLLGSTRIGMFAEDMVITPNDQYVLVADGGFSSRVAVVEIATRQLKRLNNLGSRYAQAIDITPDGQTVLVADYSGRAVHAYTLDYTTGILTHKKTVRIMPFTPVNIAISPDGRTVIAVVAGSSCCVSLYFDTAGELHYKGVIAMPSRNGQSCVFTKDGTKAYYLSNSQNKGTLVHILNVTGPGLVSPSGTSIKIWPRRGTSQLFGVDTIALDPEERYLYVTNPTLSGGIADVAIVDLVTNTQAGYIPTCGIPTGIAFTIIPEECDCNPDC
jgi:DNA-binding beta-propeller fold protein YncE